MVVRKLHHPVDASPLFEGWEETMIWSALQGVMGEVFASESLMSAAVLAGDFCFFGGAPDMGLVDMLRGTPFRIAVPQTQAWSALIERIHGVHAALRMRYAIRKEPDVFDRKYLAGIVKNLPDGFSMRQIDEKMYEKCLSQPWCRDLVSQYPDYETFRSLGLGFVVLDQERMVSGAASYCSYREGIEVEICTHKDFRRRGLALCCGAALILECLSLGLYPSWDAHNVGSVVLAEKLGYHFSHTYPVYEIQY